MTSRTLYGKIRPGSPSVPATQRDRRVEQADKTPGAKSRATVDTVALRLSRLAVILEEHDPDKLREWRLSQMMALGFFEEPE